MVLELRVAIFGLIPFATRPFCYSFYLQSHEKDWTYNQAREQLTDDILMKNRKGLLVKSAIVLLLLVVSLWIIFKVKNTEVQNMDEAARKNVPGKFVALTDGVTHYDDAGSTAAKTIVLIHGYSVPYYIWDNTYSSLVQQGFRVIRYDEFGRGFSDRPDVAYTPELYRRQLSDLLKSLNVKSPIALAGVSFGGAVATDFAVHHPNLVDKVILVDPVYNFKPDGVTEFVDNYLLTLLLEKQTVGQAKDFKYPNRFPGWAEKYRPQTRYNGFRHALVSTNYNYPNNVIQSNYRKLNSQQKDVLLIWGKDDKVVPFTFSDSLRAILNVQFFPVKDAAHLPTMEQPAIINQRIISFLGGGLNLDEQSALSK